MTSKIKLLALVATLGLFASIEGAEAKNKELKKCLGECMSIIQDYAKDPTSKDLEEVEKEFAACAKKCEDQFPRQ